METGDRNLRERILAYLKESDGHTVREVAVLENAGTGGPESSARAAEDGMTAETMTEMELAHRWMITPATLRAMRKSGRSPAWFRVGKNRIRYHLKEVEAWEQSQNIKE